jgi:hypothetical protein
LQPLRRLSTRNMPVGSDREAQREEDEEARNAEFQRRHSLPDQINPVIPPVDLDPPMDPVPNQDVGARNNTLLNLKARAKQAYDLEVVEGKYATALVAMHEIKGVIDENNPVIREMQFTDLQLEELFKRYIENPKKSETGEQSLRLMDQVVKLKKKITPSIAEEFKEWSDCSADQQIKLVTICDTGAIFTLNHANCT